MMTSWNDIEATNLAGIYAILCLANGKLYIGSSQGIRRRLTAHFNTLTHGRSECRILQNAYNKYGSSQFRYVVLEYCEVENLLEREEFFIHLYQSNRDNYGYNIRLVASTNRGIKHDKEIKEACRQRMLGHIPSEKSRQKKRDLWKQNHEKWTTQSNDEFGTDFSLMSPEGVLYKGKGIGRFARLHGLSSGSLRDLVGKRIDILHGWYRPENPPKSYAFLSPWGERTEIKEPDFKRFCLANGLHRYALIRVLAKRQQHHMGWCHVDAMDNYVEIVGPQGQQHRICRFYRTPFVKRYNLGGGVAQMVREEALFCKGWTLKKHSPFYHDIYRVKDVAGQTFCLDRDEGSRFARERGLNHRQFVRLLGGFRQESDGYQCVYRSSLIDQDFRVSVSQEQG